MTKTASSSSYQPTNWKRTLHLADDSPIGGVQLGDFPNAFSSANALVFSRSWENKPPAQKLGGLKRSPDGPYVLKRVLSPKGVTMRQLVYSPKTGKPYYTRKRFYTWLYVKTWSKGPKRKPKLPVDLMPNPLNFSSYRTSYIGGGSQTLRSTHSSGFYLKYVGNLYADLSPGIGPNAQALQNSDLHDFVLPLIEQARTRNTSRLYAKVKNQSVNLLQFLAERAQTAALLADAFRRLVKAANAMKRGRFSTAFRALFPDSQGKLANDWLLVQYGIKPLLSDIDGMAKELAVGESKTLDVTVTTKVDIPRTTVFVSAGHYDGINYDSKVHVFGNITVKRKVRLRANSIGRDFTRLGFGNLNAIAWELFPFSFVADWFIPIGNFINNEDAFAGFDVVFSTETIFVKEYVHLERNYGGASSGWSTDNVNTGFIVEKVKCIREVASSPPPLPYPSFKNPLSAGHVANALALASKLKP